METPKADRSQRDRRHFPLMRSVPSDVHYWRAVGPLGGSRILHQPIELTTDAPAFGCDLFARLLPQHHHKSDEFERFEQTIVILPVNNDVIIRRQKLLSDTRESLLVQLLASLTQQIDLKEVHRPA